MSKKAIKVLKRVMPDLNVRINFIRNFREQKGKRFAENIDGKTLNDLFHGAGFCFYWGCTQEGDMFWRTIRSKISEHESKIVIKISELK